VLFSVPEVAGYINENFEPIWVSVRPVPKITIDFGNGKKMVRTVNGNIATYICAKDGTVVDVIPGIYDRENYVAALGSVRRQFDVMAADANARDKFLHDYHTSASTKPFASVAKSQLVSTPQAVPALRPITQAESMALQKALLDDTNLNELERRPLIHSYLAEHGGSKPEEMKKWLYKEVLHADLDDPYLGFDRILTKTYPFDDYGS